jgi:hypothetical protein
MCSLLNQPLLTIVGALIGSSGAFLTRIMCEVRNHSMDEGPKSLNRIPRQAPKENTNRVETAIFCCVLISRETGVNSTVARAPHFVWPRPNSSGSFSLSLARSFSQAMNRSLPNVILGGFGTTTGAATAVKGEALSHTEVWLRCFCCVLYSRLVSLCFYFCTFLLWFRVV